MQASVEHGERFILGMHPHGIIPIHTLLWTAYADQYLRTPELGTIYGFGGMASVILYLPVLRTLRHGMAHGATRALSRPQARADDRHAPRHLPRQAPGAQSVHAARRHRRDLHCREPGTHTVVWRARRGLCRLALETGARLVPMYVFGGNDFFYQSRTSSSWLARASRAVGASFTLFWGRLWWAPWVPLVPPSGVTIAFGEPLPSQRAAAPDGRPSEEEISALNRAYEEGLRAIFDEYKAAAGYPDAVLVVQ